jgi:hypothetical protein
MHCVPTMSWRPSGLKAEHSLVNTFRHDFLLNRVPDGERIMGTSRLGSRCQGTFAGEQLPEGHSVADRNLDELLNTPSAQEVGPRPSIGWFGKAGHG